MSTCGLVTVAAIGATTTAFIRKHTLTVLFRATSYSPCRLPLPHTHTYPIPVNSPIDVLKIPTFRPR
jgi:hypothetical protein